MEIVSVNQNSGVISEAVCAVVRVPGRKAPSATDRQTDLFRYACSVTQLTGQRGTF